MDHLDFNRSVVDESALRYPEHGVTSGLLRFGIKQGHYTAYIEIADSGAGFQYFVVHDGIRIVEGLAADFITAKQTVEAELRALCSTPQ